ncbi:hypothetical protein SASPL_123945 [Salvia splendens]|uniref:Uncharacterized protein n=1 Tax=Salvia splendens TaxID=180675 RepID=A0A8X8XQ26_SALSN|nr:hypothetical protein SASPL_123945 [Salvia splendens]
MPHISLHSRSARSVLKSIHRRAALQSSSSNGVIRMNDTILRPFHSKKLHSKPELALPTLKSEFSLVPSSFLTNNPQINKSRSQLVELEESHPTFALFDVIAIPHIRIIPASATDLKSDSIKLNPSYLSTLLDSLPEVILSETAISLASGESVVHEKSTWMAGAVFVYFLSVSGTMFNIIRKAHRGHEGRRGDDGGGGGLHRGFPVHGGGAAAGVRGCSSGRGWDDHGFAGLLLGGEATHFFQ